MKTTYFLSIICALFLVNTMNAQQKIYEGSFRTKIFEGKAKYEYTEALDGSRIYNGNFSFSGKTSYISDFYYGGLGYYFTLGKLADCNEVDFDKSNFKKTFEKYGNRIEIKGSYTSGNKHKEWTYVYFSMNPQNHNWIPTDSITMNYNNGKLEGLCTYKKYSIRRKLLKTEEVTFNNDRAHGKSIIKYRKDDGSFEIFEAAFENGEPVGVWKSRNWEGTMMVYDCDRYETRWFNEETGQWSKRNGWSGGLKSSYNHHTFTAKEALDYYIYRIGGLDMGEKHEYYNNPDYDPYEKK